LINKQKTLYTNTAVNDLYDIKLCGCQTDHSPQCWSEVFFHLPKCLTLSLVLCDIYISHSSVEMYLQCGGILNNHTIANCLHSVPVKNFLKICQ